MRIFISYRRTDSAGYAGRLYDRLKAYFGEKNVFMDVSGIPAGEDFVTYLDKTIRDADVILPLIGAGWLTAGDPPGSRLKDPGDMVRHEIASALAAANKRVIPILLDNTRMPDVSDLPDNLMALSRRNAHDIRNASFDSDVESLFKKIDPDGKARVNTPAVNPSVVQPAPKPVNYLDQPVGAGTRVVQQPTSSTATGCATIIPIIMLLIFIVMFAGAALFIGNIFINGINGMNPLGGSGETTLSNCLLTVDNGFFAVVYQEPKIGSGQFGNLSTGTQVYAYRKVTSPFIYYYVEAEGLAGWISGRSGISISPGC